MHPRASSFVFAIAACAQVEQPAETPAPSWVYEPRPPAWQLGALKGRLGRSQPPQRPLAGGITGDVRVPLRLATPWAVPGVGPTRAIVFGFEGVKPAVELIDVDRGHVMWRDTTECIAPVVGVVETAVVCGGPTGTRALGLDGKPRWQSPHAFVALTGERVVVAGDEREAIVLGAGDGKELTRVKLPPTVALDSVIASCGDLGRELFALGADGKLARITYVAGKLAVPWSTPVGSVADLDPCTGDSILVASGPALIAITRATGKITGRVDGVRGHWRARDDSDRIEVATSAAVESWPRTLVGPATVLPLPPLGALLDARGDRRLVRASPFTAVVLDRTGVHSYFPFSAMGAVLGGTSVVGASWTGSPGETVTRIGIPERTRRDVRVPTQRPGVAVPAELRDLPAPAPLDATNGIVKPDTGKHAVTTFALDPTEPAVVYAIALEDKPDDATIAVVASVDLATRAWRWQRADGCGPGAPIALALAADIVACGARGTTSTVRATSRDGSARWDYETDNVDRLQGAGGAILVHDADRLAVLDASTGRLQGRFTSDDGAAMRAAAVVIDEITWLVTFEHGRLVARLPTVGLFAVWSLRVHGVVRALSPSGDGVLVDLEDGDAYRVDLRTQQVTPLPGLGLAWRAAGELVTGHAIGGVIPGIPKPAPFRPRVDRFGRPLPPPDPEAPPLWNPIPPPPPLGDSWQYTLYELTGGLRARNDYALAAPIAPAARGPKGSPLVVAYGPGLREVIVLDPRTGDPVRRVVLPGPGLAFGTVVDGTPVAGVLLAAPLRAVLF